MAALRLLGLLQVYDCISSAGDSNSSYFLLHMTTNGRFVDGNLFVGLGFGVYGLLLCLFVDANEVLTPAVGNASLGDQFKFSLRFSGLLNGLLLFKRGNPSVTLCSLKLTTGNHFTKSVPGYHCGVANGTYFLNIHNVSLRDDDTWRAQYTTTKSNEARLHVKYPPTVEVGPVAPCKGFTYTKNETNVTLKCRVLSANPAPSTFQWYHNNQSLSEGQTLVIPTVTRSTGGLYRCAAYNGVSPPGEDTVTVNVHYPPVVKVPRQTLTVNKSRDLNITCTADANPSETSIVWGKKGVQPYTQLSATNGVLGLRNLTKNDAGTYVCTYTNTVTRCDNTTEDKRGTAEVKVNVQYEPTITSFDVYSKEDQKKIAVKEKTNVTFLCQVDSLPGADITIQNEGEKKNNTETDSSLSFVLGSVGCQDTGNYTCYARNILGEVESDSLELLVKCPPRLMNSNSKTINWAVELNETAEFSVTVIAYPKPDFTLITNTTDLDFNIRSVGDCHTATGTITVYSVQEEQFNSYKLLVNNTEGELGLSLSLRPKSEPEKPVTVQTSNVAAWSLSLSWEKGFNGGAIQKFIVEYRQEGGHWITHPIMRSEEEVLHLDLKDLQPDTKYEIRLTAHNEYGPSPSVCVRARTKSGSISHYIIMYGAPAAATVVVIAIAFIIITIIVFICKTGRKKGQLDITAALNLQRLSSSSLRNQNSTPEDDGSLLPRNEYAVPQGRNVQRQLSYELPIIHQTCDQQTIHGPLSDDFNLRRVGSVPEVNSSMLPRNEYDTLQGRHLQRPIYQTCGPKANHGPLSDNSNLRRFGSVPEVSGDGYLLPRNEYAKLQGRHLQRPIYQTCGNRCLLPRNEYANLQGRHLQRPIYQTCGNRCLLPRNEYANLQGRHLQRPAYQTCGGKMTSKNVHELPRKEIMRRSVSLDGLRLNHTCGDSPSPRPVCGQKAPCSDMKRVDSAALEGFDFLTLRNKFEIPQERSVMKPKPFKKLP